MGYASAVSLRTKACAGRSARSGSPYSWASSRRTRSTHRMSSSCSRMSWWLAGSAPSRKTSLLSASSGISAVAASTSSAHSRAVAKPGTATREHDGLHRLLARPSRVGSAASSSLKSCVPSCPSAGSRQVTLVTERGRPSATLASSSKTCEISASERRQCAVCCLPGVQRCETRMATHVFTLESSSGTARNSGNLPTASRCWQRCTADSKRASARSAGLSWL